MEDEAADFRATGAALWSTFWQSTAARVLNVNERTVRRWCSGASPVPQEVWGELALVARDRAAELAEGRSAIARRLQLAGAAHAAPQQTAEAPQQRNNAAPARPTGVAAPAKAKGGRPRGSRGAEMARGG